mmetsp:Transcript_25584/g.35156  ORF Transcript_25584/g.35156 Transcript_25584/m.35156 type:complete len:685 (-) Transcript_25584:208-2262(-)
MSSNSPVQLLADARKQAHVSADALEGLLYFGQDSATRRRAITQAFQEDSNFDLRDRIFHNHTQRYVESARKCSAFHQKVEALGLTDPTELRWAMEAVNEILPTDVHCAMFIPALEYQTDDAQREKYLADAKNFRILGAYVQTELGHGSNVRALETTATFDIGTQEFVIDTPTLTATKWWPGGLGKTATHCVLHARLLLPTAAAGGIDDKGVHVFFVQLRDMASLETLPGVEVGDIGPKVGFNSIDNGYARFSGLRVPRDQLLAGVAKVHPDGTYERVRGGDKRMYGSMLAVRAALVSGAGTALAKAVTIAVRYALVRVQGYLPPPNDKVEVPVMAHPTQRRGLVPLIAFSYALAFGGARFYKNYEQFLSGDATVSLPALHAESSGLKAYITQAVADGIEKCRKLCGGHGYLQSAGIAELSNNYLALCTLEGTQQVLEPQTARFILRGIAGADPDLYARYVSYLKQTNDGGGRRHDVRDPQTQLALLGLRARAVAMDVAATLEAAVSAGVDDKVAFSNAGNALSKLAQAHAQWVLLRDFNDGVQQLVASNGVAHGGATNLGPTELDALSSLRCLFGASLLEAATGDLCAFSLLDGPSAKAVVALIEELCDALAPEAVALVDAWAMTDAHLNHSAIGASDGDVYTRLFAYAQREPLNKDAVTMEKSYKHHLRSLIERPTPPPQAKL